ncbi:MAG: hypothetical protein LBH27_02880 [Endomicrobium sp.]|jgi:hypothetical protein|nr:hypothetical protein [Endomicrobium sp.]
MVKEKYGLKGLKKFAVLAPLSFMMFVGCDRISSFSNKKKVNSDEVFNEQLKTLTDQELVLNNEIKNVRLNKGILTKNKIIDNCKSNLKNVDRLRKKVSAERARIKANQAEREFVRAVIAEAKASN